jgi:RNA polymerase sigma factor (sigma-70 family)
MPNGEAPLTCEQLIQSVRSYAWNQAKHWADSIHQMTRDDLMQEAMVAVLKTIPTYDHARDFRRLATRAIRNHMINLFRYYKSRRAVLDANVSLDTAGPDGEMMFDPPSTQPGPLDIVMAREMLEIAAAALKDQPALASIVRQRLEEGKSAPEIAADRSVFAKPVSRERVRQKYAEAIGRICTYINKKGARRGDRC